MPVFITEIMVTINSLTNPSVIYSDMRYGIGAEVAITMIDGIMA